MNTLSIIALVVAVIWTIADIIFYVIISEMKDDAERDLKKANDIRLGNERELAHIFARKEAIGKREDQIIAEENLVKRKWADLEKAQKEYSAALAELKDREAKCAQIEKNMLEVREMVEAHKVELEKRLAETEAELEVKQSELEAMKKKGGRK